MRGILRVPEHVMYSEITKKLINSSIEKRNRKFEGKCDWLKIPPRLTCLFI